MRQKLILFDIDGTLVTRDRTHDISFTVGLKKVIGMNVNVEIFGVNSGKTVRSIVSEIMRKKGFTEEEILSKMDAVFNGMIEYYKENIRFDNSLKSIPHVMELLVELERRDHVLGLVTGNIEEIAKLKLKKVGLFEFFRIGGFGGSSTIRSELALEAVKKACEKLKIKFDKGDIFLIGDTPLDIECGKEIGVKTIAVSTGPYRIDELKKHNPDYLFNDFSNVGSILKAIENG
jgi:phosphoglycolate phosphatase-like HAD superfamily hydrolase